MKKVTVLICMGLIILFACTNSRNSSTLIANPGELKPDEYVVQTDKDTVLRTPRGASISIPRNALNVESAGSVTIEVIEAYSPKEILLGGLSTSSGNELLSSGGMIYINAKAGQKVSITKSITVSIPTKYIEPGMKLFRGESRKDGSVNWTDPGALPALEQYNRIQEGEQLFQNKCANCHFIDKDGTGPNLANFIPHKGAEKGIEGYRIHRPHYINQFSATDTSHSTNNFELVYYCNLKEMFGSMGPAFGDLTDEELEKIYEYVQNESYRRGLPQPSHAYLKGCVDSCLKYKEHIGSIADRLNDLKQRKELLEEQVEPMVTIKENGNPIPPNSNNNSPSSIPPGEEKVTPEQYGSLYYQFTIETFGWFNIDILMKNVNGAVESELFVRIVGEYRQNIQVYLIIPVLKVNVQGGPSEQAGKLAFLYKTGKINLPQGTQAYILAVTESESSIAFALKGFTTSSKQEIEIALKYSTKEEFMEAVNSIQAIGLKINVSDTKNATELRKLGTDTKELEKQLQDADGLKPRNCNCDCLNRDTTTPFSLAE